MSQFMPSMVAAGGGVAKECKTYTITAAPYLQTVGYARGFSGSIAPDEPLPWGSGLQVNSVTSSPQLSGYFYFALPDGTPNNDTTFSELTLSGNFNVGQRTFNLKRSDAQFINTPGQWAAWFWTNQPAVMVNTRQYTAEICRPTGAVTPPPSNEDRFTMTAANGPQRVGYSRDSFGNPSFGDCRPHFFRSVYAMNRISSFTSGQDEFGLRIQGLEGTPPADTDAVWREVAITGQFSDGQGTKTIRRRDLTYNTVGSLPLSHWTSGPQSWTFVAGQQYQVVLRHGSGPPPPQTEHTLTAGTDGAITAGFFEGNFGGFGAYGEFQPRDHQGGLYPVRRCHTSVLTQTVTFGFVGRNLPDDDSVFSQVRITGTFTDGQGTKTLVREQADDWRAAPMAHQVRSGHGSISRGA